MLMKQEESYFGSNFDEESDLQVSKRPPPPFVMALQKPKKESTHD